MLFLTLGKCFVDSPRRVLPHKYWRDSKMTVEKCKLHCKRHGYNYAGLENWVECWCGNSLPSADKETAPSDCFLTCPGNRGQMCGAGWRINVYTIGS